ncbi:hypothetical protein [Streptomonospora sp. PA3]|uniref:hypothetical protein n=1 Tax=Streptomonospora sp. PA3 TaxID=2607326 RepID=UPI0012DE2F6A|nr:hypothetical protein [Streptomonospora sp. PA3]
MSAPGPDGTSDGTLLGSLEKLLKRVYTVVHEVAVFTLVLLGGGLLDLHADGSTEYAPLLTGVGAGVFLVWLLSGLWAWALAGTPTPAAKKLRTRASETPPTGTPWQRLRAYIRRFRVREETSKLQKRLRYGLASSLALVLLAGIAFQTFAAPCDPPAEVVVATTPDGEPAVEAAAAAFAHKRAEDSDGLGRDCRSVRMVVYAVADGQRMRDALVGAWDTGLGPLPHVWIPGSTAEALLVEDALAEQGQQAASTVSAPPEPPSAGGGSGSADAAGAQTGDTSRPPVMQVTDIEVGEWTRLTPLVLALPSGMAERLTGGDADEVEMDDPYARLREEFGRGVRVVRTDPRDSVSSMLHTAFLYHSRGAITQNGEVVDEARAARVEAELELGAAAQSGGDLVCEVARSAGEGVPVAALTTEAAVYETFVAGRWRTTCPGEEDARDEIAALYSPELPVLDHPFVRISGVSATVDGGATRPVTESAAVDGEVDRFADFLTGLRDSPDAFTPLFRNDDSRPTPIGVYQGYRDDQGNGRVAARLDDAPETIPNALGEPGVWSAKAAAVTELYTRAQGGTVLLALDTSTSMDIPHRKFATAVDEAAELAAAVGTEDALGLWAFPKGSAPSAADAAAVVELDRSGGDGDRFADALAGLAPVKESTPLRSVIADGADALQEWSQGAEAAGGDRPPPAPVLVVVTDGVGEPADGGLGIAEMRRRLDGTDVRVRVLAVGDETRRWGRSDPCEVGGIPELTEHDRIECVPAELDKPGEAAVGLLDEARRA